MSYWALKKVRSGIEEWCIHHGPRDALDNLLLYVLAASKDDTGSPKPRRRRLAFYSLSWIKEGECWYAHGGGKASRLTAGDVVAIAPGVVHRWGGRGKPFREDWVSFFGPVAEQFQSLGLFDPARPVISIPKPDRLSEIAGLVQDTFSLEAQLRAGILLQCILTDARFSREQEALSHYPLFQELLKRIAVAPQVHLHNEEMATFCRMTESVFRKRFRAEVGMPPHRYCERMRMSLACVRLRDSGQRILDIAEELGYEDSLYFSKRFRTVVGISPRAYRRSANSH